MLSPKHVQFLELHKTNLLGWGHAGPIHPPNIQLFENYPGICFHATRLQGNQGSLLFFFVSKFHVLDLLQNLNCGNAVKKRKLNWQAVTLGIQRQFMVVDTTSCRNPKLV